MVARKKLGELEYVLEQLHLGLHSGDGIGINRLHWMGFVDFIIHNPSHPKKQLEHKLISVLCVTQRTVQEYINCAIAWNVLILEGGELRYNRTYPKNQKKLTEITAPSEKTDDEILKNRR